MITFQNQSKKETGFNTCRCQNLFLGGTADATGLCLATASKACDKLRCTNCDFKCVYIGNKMWVKNADYLFFRNNFPDESKLAKKLSSKKGIQMSD
jgi:hypothetical protein